MSPQSDGFAWLCIGWSENDSSSSCSPRRDSVEDSSADLGVPKICLKCAVPRKDKAVSPWAFSTSLLVLTWREVKGFLFPKAWCCPSIYLASAAVSSHKGLLKAGSIFCHPFTLLTAFPSPFWAVSVPALVGWRDCREIWVLKLFLFRFWQKPGSFQHIVCEKEISSLRESLNTCVCVHVFRESFWCCFTLKLSSEQIIPSPLFSFPEVIWDTVWPESCWCLYGDK